MNDKPTILVIIGITGDLARRKLLPALAEIARSGALPQHFGLVGVSRRVLTAEDVVADTPGLATDEAKSFVRDHLHMYQMDIDSTSDYQELASHLDTIEKEWGQPAQRLFYLSVPPQVSQPIVHHLGEAGFGALTDTKLLLEKPFGSDLSSAQDLITSTKRYFTESQLYRIDHYLAKEMAQNIIVFRQGNSLFKRTWNNQCIEKIELIATEKIGIEGRVAFYEQTGALRDFVQSHLLQLAALTLMDLPTNDDWTTVPSLRLSALEALLPPQADELDSAVIRGQYQSYASETANPGTPTETFVSMTLHSRAPRWEGVPIVLTTGKSLNRKATEIRIHYKKEDEQEANILSLHIQPTEGVEILMWAKKPGYERELERLPLNFTYSDHYNSLPEAYERVLVDAMRGDHSLFASSDEVLASWRILAPIQQRWAMQGTSGLIMYPDNSAPHSILDTKNTR